MSAVDLTWLSQQFPELSQTLPLAKGGQKFVAAAVHPTDGDVVLKVMLQAGYDEETRREILAVNQVASPRVPKIFAHGKLQTHIGERLWIREQRIQGDTLRSILGAGPLQVTEILRLGLHLLEALNSAESVNIIHRDVKPENILRDSHGNFWLIDFGLARHLDLESLTATNLQGGKGTLGYGAPEQFQNRKREMDSRTDLFAVGVTLHECITGANYFLRSPCLGPFQVLKRVETELLPSPICAMKNQSSFTDFLGALTAKRRDQRPRTVNESLAWLREISVANGVT